MVRHARTIQPCSSGIDTDSDLPLCAGCGRCCHLVVELRPGDSVPEDLVVEHAGARCLDQRGDGACVALDPVTRLCTIYDIRPLTCREFNRGEPLCRRILGRPALAPSAHETSPNRIPDRAARPVARSCNSAFGRLSAPPRGADSD